MLPKGHTVTKIGFGSPSLHRVRLLRKVEGDINYGREKTRFHFGRFILGGDLFFCGAIFPISNKIGGDIDAISQEFEISSQMNAKSLTPQRFLDYRIFFLQRLCRYKSSLKLGGTTFASASALSLAAGSELSLHKQTQENYVKTASFELCLF